jgi:hypothetical protein
MSNALNRVLDRLDAVSGKEPRWMAKCPAHADRSPSLRIAVGDDGRVLLKCHAGCETSAVVKALGLGLADLFESRADYKPDFQSKAHREEMAHARIVQRMGQIARERGEELNDEDLATLCAAVAKLSEAGELTHEQEPKSELDTWPADLADVAFYGLAGELARLIEPQTESDVAAILLQILVAFGALVGRGPHVKVEGDEHHGNLFAILVGDSSKARKGTSWGRVRAIFEQANDWPQVVTGLSTGEGVKWAVRDPIYKMEYDKKTQTSTEVLSDPGVSDKRLLVVEPEFAQVLVQAPRMGNTLSATIRSIWDTGRLQTLTKNDSVVATNAHISIIGHITDSELRFRLTSTDAGNGFANRFLYMSVRRSKPLPFGGEPIPELVIQAMVSRINSAAQKARTVGLVKMSDAAAAIWIDIYPTLSDGQSGLIGAVTARAEAQCLRLALLYALLDESAVIGDQHLLAAIAVWTRAAASAAHIFRAEGVEKVADAILVALRAAGPNGVTRTYIRDLFNKHESADRITAALEFLDRQNLAEMTKVQGERGPPTQQWRSKVPASEATTKFPLRN